MERDRSQLTPYELLLVSKICEEGITVTEAARHFDRSVRVTRWHLSNVYQKLAFSKKDRAGNLLKLVVWYWRDRKTVTETREQEPVHRQSMLA